MPRGYHTSTQPRLHTLSTRCANDALSISQHGQPLTVTTFHHFGPCALLSFSHTLLFSVLKTDQILHFVNIWPLELKKFGVKKGDAVIIWPSHERCHHPRVRRGDRLCRS
ncbi:hypothetical protein A4X06_0g9758 [Tilletia controversa]|uniref:Uncharacterized protein n=1 Tax=Tilletia controversa TaxID=13291 RepID=A0A8X7MHP9_9BASI|nr:hypothetical protein CF336_g9784 [Tilletia laevis]KAE8235786.1 hypothetical protein A4X06_0g9758 [Tilletia controversa]